MKGAGKSQWKKLFCKFVWNRYFQFLSAMCKASQHTLQFGAQFPVTKDLNMYFVPQKASNQLKFNTKCNFSIHETGAKLTPA